MTSREPYGTRKWGGPRCINAEPGTFNHECGKPATWICTSRTGFAACYCDDCKAHGFEARDVVDWRPILPISASDARAVLERTEAGEQHVVPGAGREPLRATLERRMQAPKPARVEQRGLEGLPLLDAGCRAVTGNLFKGD